MPIRVRAGGFPSPASLLISRLNKDSRLAVVTAGGGVAVTLLTFMRSCCDCRAPGRSQLIGIPVKHRVIRADDLVEAEAVRESMLDGLASPGARTRMPHRRERSNSAALRA